MNSLMQLLFPTACLICERPGVELCLICGSKIVRNHKRFVLEGMEVRAAALYGDELARIILLAKEKNNLPARRVLVGLLMEPFGDVVGSLLDDFTITLIPIPSRNSASRKRGYRHSLLLTKALAAAISDKNLNRVGVREALRVNRKTADQTALNKRERDENLANAFSVVGAPWKGSEATQRDLIFLIDDLVTTGSSMREGLRALKEAGINPFGAVSAGVSPRLIS